jgi:hypothetical protein
LTEERAVAVWLVFQRSTASVFAKYVIAPNGIVILVLVILVFSGTEFSKVIAATMGSDSFDIRRRDVDLRALATRAGVLRTPRTQELLFGHDYPLTGSG